MGAGVVIVAGELVQHFGVLRAGLGERFQRERGGLRHPRGLRGVAQQRVSLWAVRVGFERFFGELERGARVFFHERRAFERRGGQTGEEAFLALGRENLRFAQQLAPVEKLRRVLEHRLEQ